MHITNEGEVLNPGLNIGFGWRGKSWQNPWIRFVWCSVDFNTYTKSIYYFRIRSFMRPWFIFWKSKESIINSYFSNNDLVAITREAYSDLVNYIPKVCREEVRKQYFVPIHGEAIEDIPLKEEVNEGSKED